MEGGFRPGVVHGPIAKENHPPRSLPFLDDAYQSRLANQKHFTHDSNLPRREDGMDAKPKLIFEL